MQVFSPAGELLGIIKADGFTYPRHPANVTFGGSWHRTLYVTARKAIYRVEMEAVGHAFTGRAR